MRVLSVDDSKLVRLYVRNAADVLGFEYLEAANGKEALEVLEREGGKIDLVLLDWHMPEMDGMTLLKMLKNDDRYRDIAVTMVTTEIERDNVLMAIEAGAKNYVMKPFTQEKLISKILEGLGMA
jgi:two-component system, chemotaxis family, chemotaxis protein CheY